MLGAAACAAGGIVVKADHQTQRIVATFRNIHIVFPGDAARFNHVVVAAPAFLEPFPAINAIFSGDNAQCGEGYVAASCVVEGKLEPDFTIDANLGAIL